MEALGIEKKFNECAVEETGFSLTVEINFPNGN
jgi:hypothetical protein